MHIISGVVALYFGFAGSMSGARGFCLVFGIVYLALGIFGMVLGTDPGKMWHVGPLEFGTADHGYPTYSSAPFFWPEDCLLRNECCAALAAHSHLQVARLLVW